jgi:hypothetical protein
MYYLFVINRYGMVALGFVLVLSLGGCKNPTAEVIGKWKCTNVDLPASIANNPNAAQMKSALTSSTIEFKADKSYSMNVSVAIDGTWTVDGSTVNMTTTKVMGMDAAQFKQVVEQQAKTNPMVAQQLKDNPDALDQMTKPRAATLSDDGKTLTLKGTSGKGGDMAFSKESSP